MELNGVKIKLARDRAGELAYEQGYCVIIVTHDMDIASQVDCVYQVRDGQLS